MRGVFLENKNELYRGEALLPAKKTQTFAGIFLIALFCASVFFLASHIPYGWIAEIAAIIISAFLINAVLKQGTFTVTYVLMSDKLLIFTRYGLIEMQTYSIKLEEATFSEQYIYTNNNKIRFYPDKKLKSLLNL